MDPAAIQQENDALRQMWEQHDAAHLDHYLVAGVEDPRLNIQSILTRALLADSLFPDRFAALINEELRFGTILTWLHLFNTKPDGAHEIVPREKYHWNLLSRAALLETGRALGCAADLIELAPLLQHKFAYAGHHNPRAATLILKKPV
jgi:hypothetical protein